MAHLHLSGSISSASSCFARLRPSSSRSASQVGPRLEAAASRHLERTACCFMLEHDRQLPPSAPFRAPWFCPFFTEGAMRETDCESLAAQGPRSDSPGLTESLSSHCLQQKMSRLQEVRSCKDHLELSRGSPAFCPLQAQPALRACVDLWRG